MGLLDLWKRKQTPVSHGGLALAMPLLETDEALDLAELGKRIQSGAPETWSDIEAKEGVLQLHHPSGFMTFSLMPVPLPQRELESAIRSSWHWPEAAQQAPKHRAHAIAAAKAESRLDAALMLTSFLAAVLQSVPTMSGIYWGGAGMVLSRKFFLTGAPNASKDDLPVALWISVLALPGSTPGRRSVATRGMQAFDLMDLELREWPGSFEELLPRAWNIAEYLISNGPVLKDGDTIGYSATEKCRVRHVASTLEPSRKVYRVEAPS